MSAKIVWNGEFQILSIQDYNGSQYIIGYSNEISATKEDYYKMLLKAFERGKSAKATEIRDMLGV